MVDVPFPKRLDLQDLAFYFELISRFDNEGFHLFLAHPGKSLPLIPKELNLGKIKDY